MSNSNIGARKDRNIQNHLFIIYGVINYVIRNKNECIDLQIYDLLKAFDSLWLDDCLNDLFDTLPPSLRNDKLSLLYQSNVENLVAVNTAVGITERVNIPKIVQQGGTWGPSLCSNSVDTLGKKCRDRGKMHYPYKNTVRILPLAMVDDLIGISKCGIDSVELNSFLNSQIELKKLRFHVPDKSGKSKCYKMHVGAKHETCPILKVHGTVMAGATEETYLGDIISSDGKNRKNVAKRISKGVGIITQIMLMLDQVSLGEHYIEIALLFRQAKFLNGILTNCGIWYGLTNSDIKEFEDLDLSLLRKIFKAPISTPKEAFFLELGILPIGVIIKARRIIYLHYLVTRRESEMLSQFFRVQWNDPSVGDWTETVQINLEEFGIPSNLEVIKSKSRESFKRLVKCKAQEYALMELRKEQEKHSKMANLIYTELKAQDYLTSENTRAEYVINIFKFRVRMAPFGENFRGGEDHIMCPLCQNHWDSQTMSFQCSYFKGKVAIECDMKEILSDKVTVETGKTLTNMLRIREDKLKENNS